MKSLRDDYNKLLAPYIKSGSAAPEGKTPRQRDLLAMCAFLQPHLRRLQGKPIESYRKLTVKAEVHASDQISEVSKFLT